MKHGKLRFRSTLNARIARFIHHRLGRLHGPVTIGGALVPVLLPHLEAWLKLLERLFAGILSFGLHHWVVAMADRYMPRHSHLAGKDFLRPPDYLQQSFDVPYIRIRRVARDASDEGKADAGDLEAFVAMSDDEPAIRGAHFELTPEERYRLYQDWWQYNTDSFLMLEQHFPDGRVETVGVSIVLPLSELAARDFSSAKVKTLQL